MEFVYGYVTVGSIDEARHIGRALVDERLAACVNILPNVLSLYLWKGQIQEESEVCLLAKTRRDLFDDFARCVKSLHSYETPCIVALPIVDGDEAYLEWASTSLKS